MAVRYLKKAEKTAATGEQDVRETVARMLDEIEAGGEEKARDYSRKFDSWQGEILVSKAEREAAAGRLSERVKADIAFAHERVRRFA